MPKSYAGRLTFALIVVVLVGIITRNAYHHVRLTTRGTNAPLQPLPDIRLYHAALEGNLNEVNALLARGADVNAKTRYGIPLQAALRGQFASPHDPHVEVVRTLLAHHANPNPPQGDWHHFLGNLPLAPGESPLVLAIAYHPTVVPELLQQGADVNVGYGEPLRQAIRSRHLDMVRELLRRGVNVNPSRPPTTDYAYASRPQTPFSPSWWPHSPERSMRQRCDRQARA